MTELSKNRISEFNSSYMFSLTKRIPRSTGKQIVKSGFPPNLKKLGYRIQDHLEQNSPDPISRAIGETI